MSPRVVLSVAVVALAMAGPGRVHAQEAYPNRPVKIIAPQAPGGGVDLVARIIADRLRAAMGQPFVIENQAGAGGAMATQATARAHPDGYTLMIGYVATHATNPAVKQNLGYDAIKDFTPIASVNACPMLRYGTAMLGTPEACLNCSITRWLSVPTPDVP